MVSSRGRAVDEELHSHSTRRAKIEVERTLRLDRVVGYFFGCALGGRMPFRRRYIAAAP